MKKSYLKLTAAILAALTISFTSCDDDDEGSNNNTTDQFNISADITENTTWETGNVYYLKSRVAVTNGATLTIEPGVIVKGDAGTGTNATALIIARGSKIMAEGTANEPIIFTSVADEIEPTEIDSEMADDVDGLWGGLIVLGNAPISPKSNGTEASIEGIPADDENGKYGGNDATDNSGVLKYISIRHGGSNIGEGNEINGLTLGGVGSGTTIQNIEIVANQDDGVEFFGGTVNVSNILVWNNGDDAIDTDQAWAGTLDNALVINPGDKAFELDGPEGDYEGAGHTIQNVTVYMESCGGGYDDDDNTDAKVMNVFFTKITDATGTENDYNSNGNFVISNFEFDVTPVDLDDDEDTPDVAPVAADYFADIAASTEASELTEVTTATVGANTSVFNGWTFAGVRDAF
ncbi:MAG: hypothetical protein KQH79_05575 [Bacteroidetes bacterium]|nr:hypothetical protein [Bacteroidota bacterium]